MSDLSDRAKLRSSEERKLLHAMTNIEELVIKHLPQDLAERWNGDLFMLRKQLQALIRNQHIKDERYAKFKNSSSLPYEGF